MLGKPNKVYSENKMTTPIEDIGLDDTDVIVMRHTSYRIPSE